MKKHEFFKIDRITRKYDRKTHTFTINIAYRTATEITPRTIAVAEAFGLGVDEEPEFIIYDNVKLKIGLTDIVYITGDSGSGKSVLLKSIERGLSEINEVTNITDMTANPEKPLIDTVGKTFREGLELLSRVGLNDAFLFIRRYKELSDGQKYRYCLAKLIENEAQYWIADEFAATLDRDTAKIVAFNLQKLARQRGKASILATTHTDLFEDLKPSVHIHKRFGKEIEVHYYPNEINRECSLSKEMRIEEGTREDYHRLSGFHYRSKKAAVIRKVFRMMRGDELVGVIVYSYPPSNPFGRKKAFGRRLTVQEANQLLSIISRVVIHPKYRTIGLGVKIVKETLPLADTPYVETIAVMAQYNPFFERAGMTKWAVKEPPKNCVRAVEQLRELGFNSVFIGSQKYNLRVLRGTNIDAVRRVLINTRHYMLNKYFDSDKGFGASKQEYMEKVKTASLEKLAKLIQVLALIIQPKVYLLWRNSNL